ncbi:FAD-dependent thymidylate synthase [Candidatus Termititenax spirochaetophilus]|uniref:FAD-dependent thymidylate synthase n=1 Tax=Candidatus Termititenax spirochaetophilus TaxID=2218522 RepID=A0A388T8R1_9BACT|nr:FAD-dependent thymidylate synthase [Candidatus Termititenax spirochaetophilus]
MKVILSGYNLDAEVIDELKASSPARLDITPETLSAAYARISRDPRPVNELRHAARAEIEKSRKSNQAIIFGLGHSSVAEHAVFNFDVLEVSRYAMEELEKFRLVSFTEKSQRYITLDSAYHTPAELKGTRFEAAFHALLKEQNELYFRLFEKLKVYVYTKYADLAQDPKNKNLLEGYAKEDARYITSLAMCSQAGMTINARNLEKMLRRFASHPLAELKKLGQSLHALVKDITPSIIKYPEANAYDQNTYPELAEYCQKAARQYKTKQRQTASCVLVDHTKDGDNKILTALLVKTAGLDWTNAYTLIKKMSKKQKLELFKISIKNMQIWDQLLREYELVDLTYELIVSASCFAQLKRHRMATLITGQYEPRLSLRIPPAVSAVGMSAEFRRLGQKTAKLHAEIKKEIPAVADYVLTNAHQRRMLCKVNLRELYHISRLREDSHAQWDIRQIAALMSAAARKALPLTASFLVRHIGTAHDYSFLSDQLAETRRLF